MTSTFATEYGRVLRIIQQDEYELSHFDGVLSIVTLNDGRWKLRFNPTPEMEEQPWVAIKWQATDAARDFCEAIDRYHLGMTVERARARVALLNLWIGPLERERGLLREWLGKQPEVIAEHEARMRRIMGLP